MASGVLAAWDVLTDTTDFRQLELWLAVITLQALVSLDSRHLLIRHHSRLWVVVRVWATSYCRLVPASSDLVVEELILHSLTLPVVTAVKNLYGLLIVSILIDMHYFLASDFADDSWSD